MKREGREERRRYTPFPSINKETEVLDNHVKKERKKEIEE